MTCRSIGYALTSGGGDSKQAAGLEVQVKALKDAGCAAVFQEIVSTRTPENERHQLQAALNAVVEGDEIVVTALSRIGRTQREVINRLHLLQEQARRKIQNGKVSRIDVHLVQRSNARRPLIKTFHRCQNVIYGGLQCQVSTSIQTIH